jgi:hypothetical protein
MIKKIILAFLLTTTLSNTAAMEITEQNGGCLSKKPISDNTLRTLSMLELYEAGKIDTQKGLGLRGTWQPELEFLDTNKAEWMTRDILFAILDERKDFTFYRNGKYLQITNANCSFRSDFPTFYSHLYCEPLSKKDSAMIGWYFEGMKYDNNPIYFEIKVVKGSKTKKIDWDDCSSPDFDHDLGIDNLKRKS